MAETENGSSRYYENEVFVSYAWGGESERVVDELERAFAEHGVHLVRDKKDLDYKGSIEAFEHRIGQGQCIALVISDRYLRSKHCMYELLEVHKNQNLHERIFPIVLADARIYEPTDRLEYVKYWDEQIKNLNQAMKAVEVLINMSSATEDLKNYVHIRANIDHLMDLLRDLNVLTAELLAADDYSKVINAVKNAIAKKQVAPQSNKAILQTGKIFDSKSRHLPNPFIFGRPVDPSEFINREPELHTVFNRLRNSESTAIVGEPRIGKTSLLMKLADEKTQMNYLGDCAKNFMFWRLNCHIIDSNFTPTTFWEKTLEPFRRLANQVNINLWLEQLHRTSYASETLEAFFDYCDEQKQQLIIMLDEFDLLLNHPQFQEFAFYATLRAVAAYRSCSIVITTRYSLAELQEHVDKLPFSGGSPVFNFLMELRLKPFDDKNIESLLDRAGDFFSSNDRLVIKCTTGNNPYLVQAIAANLLDMADITSRNSAIEQFFESAHSHFDDLWCALSDRERTTVLILGLVECARCNSGSKFDYDEIKSLTVLGAGLHVLHNLGLAEPVITGQQPYRSGLIWQEEQWRLSAQAFVCWVYKVLISKTHSLRALDKWLKNEGYVSLLKPEQWERLVASARLCVGPGICNIGLKIGSQFK